jgi:hypothetical protein
LGKRRKQLSAREQRRAEAKRSQQREAAWRKWDQENIAPLFEQFSPFHEPDDVRFYPPHPSATKPEPD